MSKKATHTRGIRRLGIGLILVAGLLLAWVVIAWGPRSPLTSLIKGREKPIIWGAVLSAPMPVVAISIIVSLRILKVGTEQPRKQQPGAQWRAPTRELQTEAQTSPSLRAEGSVEAWALQRQIEEQLAQEQQALRQSSEQAQEQLAQEQWWGREQQDQDWQTQEQQAQKQERQEQRTDQEDLIQDWFEQLQDWLGQIQDQLRQMQEEIPQIRQPAAPMLKQLGQLQEKAPFLTPPEMQGQMKQIQEQMGRMYYELPEGISSQVLADLAQMQRQMVEMMAQMEQQVTQTEQLEEQQDQDKINLEDLTEDFLEDMDISDLFEVEEIEDPLVKVLTADLENIDVLDLLGECREVADQLRKGNSLVLGLNGIKGG
jgi:chromosome segregation ATPase